MRLYFETASRDRIGNRSYNYYFTDSFTTKAALKRRSGTYIHITRIWTNEQASDTIKKISTESYL